MKRISLFLCLLVAAMCVRSSETAGVKQLAEEFSRPPLSARPGVYWYFMDGNLSQEGMTKDLEAMRRAGIGYVVFLEVNVGVARGPVDFMSDEWLCLFRHAVRECERLDIQMVLGIGPGWTGSGGPWVQGNQSMQHLVASSAQVEGGRHVSVRMEVPRANPPFFGEGAFTPETHRQWQEYYEDVCLLAFPTPSSEGRLQGTQEKALYIRAPFSSQPGVKPYLPAPVMTHDQPIHPAAVQASEVIDLTGLMSPDGHVEWDAPQGTWTLMRFGSRNNGNATRPAPVPGVGMECDKFDREALHAHFSHFTDRLFQTIEPLGKGFGGLKYLHMDSWEMGAQNWTGKFRSEFQRRRGYDPQPFYPVYTGIIVGDSVLSERFLWDVRKTAQELIIENHTKAAGEYAHAHGLQLSIEPYDMNPTADLELAVAADVPMAEFWSEGFGFITTFAAAEGTSAAHLIGQPVVPAEAFTAERDGWRQYPGRMKDQTDWALAAGINRLMYHTFQHQCLPDSMRPGMTMGPYGVHWDRNQTWWPMSDAYHTYVARCQHLLQQGRTVADILYLAPESMPHVFRAPASAYIQTSDVNCDRREYNFDGCPPSLLATARVQDGRIVFPSGASYRVLVMPDYPTATPHYLQQILRLLREGATVVGTPPLNSPSLQDYPRCDRQVAQLVKKIWGKKNETSRRVGRGTLVRYDGPADNLYPPYSHTAQLLQSMHILPDFIDPSGAIRYTHRTAPQGEIYFISNRTSEVQHVTLRFRASGLRPELWIPQTGERRALPQVADDGQQTDIPLRFGPHESFFLVFSAEGSGAPQQNGSNYMEPREALTVTGPWKVTFDSQWGEPTPQTFQVLTDWTESDNPLIRYYSGTATYECTFHYAGEPQRAMELDLGRVCNMARVWLNGTLLGTSWNEACGLSLGNALRKGENRLRIDVVNLWQNRLIGDMQPDTKRRFTHTTWQHYRAGDALLPSGLLGPVRVMQLVP